MTAIHDLTAIEMLRRFRDDALAHRSLGRGRGSTSRAGSRISTRSTPTSRSARAPRPPPRPSAGRRARRTASSTACRFRSRTTSRPRACRCRSAPRRRPLTPGRAGRARRRAAARGRRDHLLQDHDAGLRHDVVGRFELPHAHPQSVGHDEERRADRVPARARRARPVMARCMSAPTSAARCACRPAGAASSALKPSLGRIPVDPPYVGALHRTDDAHGRRHRADDAVLSQPDWRDGMSLPPHDIAWTILPPICTGLRIGLMLDAGYRLPVDPEVQGRRRGGREMFRRGGRDHRAGAPIMTRAMIDGLDDFWRARSWGDIEPLPAETAREDPALYAAMGGGRREAVRRRSGARLQPDDGDARGSPRCCSASRLSCCRRPRRCRPFRPSFPRRATIPEKPFEHIGFTVPWNMSEQPAVSINCGFTTSGLPIGLQIVGRRFDDHGVLRLAKAYETARGPITTGRSRRAHDPDDVDRFSDRSAQGVLDFQHSRPHADRPPPRCTWRALHPSTGSMSGTMIGIAPAACAAVMP